MPTPTIYSHLQTRLQSVHAGLTAALACSLVSVLAALVLIAKYDPVGAPSSYGIFVLLAASLGGGIMWLVGVAEYQQEPTAWRIPLLGKLYRALVSRPTPWGEAMTLNFTLATPIGLVVFVYLVFGSSAR